MQTLRAIDLVRTMGAPSTSFYGDEPPCFPDAVAGVVEVDLSDAVEISSSLIGALVELTKRADEVRLLNLSDSLARRMKTMRILPRFTVPGTK